MKKKYVMAVAAMASVILGAVLGVIRVVNSKENTVSPEMRTIDRTDVAEKKNSLMTEDMTGTGQEDRDAYEEDFSVEDFPVDNFEEGAFTTTEALTDGKAITEDEASDSPDASSESLSDKSTGKDEEKDEEKVSNATDSSYDAGAYDAGAEDKFDTFETERIPVR